MDFLTVGGSVGGTVVIVGIFMLKISRDWGKLTAVIELMGKELKNLRDDGRETSREATSLGREWIGMQGNIEHISRDIVTLGNNVQDLRSKTDDLGKELAKIHKETHARLMVIESHLNGIIKNKDC